MSHPHPAALGIAIAALAATAIKLNHDAGKRADAVAEAPAAGQATEPQSAGGAKQEAERPQPAAPPASPAFGFLEKHGRSAVNFAALHAMGQDGDGLGVPDDLLGQLEIKAKQGLSGEEAEYMGQLSPTNAWVAISHLRQIASEGVPAARILDGIVQASRMTIFRTHAEAVVQAKFEFAFFRQADLRKAWSEHPPTAQLGVAWSLDEPWVSQLAQALKAETDPARKAQAIAAAFQFHDLIKQDVGAQQQHGLSMMLEDALLQSISPEEVRQRTGMTLEAYQAQREQNFAKVKQRRAAVNAALELASAEELKLLAGESGAGLDHRGEHIEQATARYGIAEQNLIGRIGDERIEAKLKAGGEAN